MSKRNGKAAVLDAPAPMTDDQRRLLSEGLYVLMNNAGCLARNVANAAHEVTVAIASGGLEADAVGAANNAVHNAAEDIEAACKAVDKVRRRLAGE